MLRFQLNGRALLHSLPLVLARGFHASKSSQSDWMANNDILLSATTAMKRKREKCKDSKTDIKVPLGLRDSTYYSNYNALSRNHSKKPLKRRKNVLVKWNTGSDRAKEAATSVMSKIFQMNREGTIKIINPETNKMEETNIRYFAKGIDLSEVGLSIVDVDQIDEYCKVPLIKLVESRVALKRYSDELAKQKEKELMELGVIRRGSKATESDKGESSIKRLKLSWEIKPDDLVKQKAHEIVTQLKKGFKVYIYIDSKNNGNSRNWLDSFEGLESMEYPTDNKLSKAELEQRTFILDKIIEIFGEYSIQPLIDGSLRNKMLVKLAPKPTTIKHRDRNALKEQKRKERQEKLQRRIEKKQQRQHS